jgi:hypothetical protein
MLLLLRDRTAAPWDAAVNLGIRGFLRRDGSVYAPKPDLCIYGRRVPRNVPEISLAEYGPPLLVVEVASPSTWEDDLGEKAATYARGGVPAYLVFDVSGELLPRPVLAWHLRPGGGGTLEPWAPGEDGRWHTALGVALAPDGRLLRAYDAAGLPLPTLAEAEARRQAAEAQVREVEARRQAAEARAQAAEARLAALEEQLRERRGEEG